MDHLDSPDPGSLDPGSLDPGSLDPESPDPGSTDLGSPDPGSSDPGSPDSDDTIDTSTFIHTLPITPLMRNRGYKQMDKQAEDAKSKLETNNLPHKDDGDTADLNLDQDIAGDENNDGNGAKDGHNHGNGEQLPEGLESKEHQCLACEMDEIVNTAGGTCSEGSASDAVKVPHTHADITDGLGNIPSISGQADQKDGVRLPPIKDLLGAGVNLEEAADGKKYPCLYCEKSFSRKDSRKRHERIHTQDRPHKCSYCEKTFITKHHMKVHEGIHTGIKEFACNYCDKAFHVADKRNRHEKIHLKESTPVPVPVPFSAFSEVDVPIDNNQKEADQVDAKADQIEVEGGAIRYICRFCPKSFPRVDSRKRHERTHTGQKPHKCAFCEHSFVTAYHKRLHERTHTKEKPHTCGICQKGFSRMDSLKRHEKLHE